MTADRKVLNERINRRVERMFEQGLIEEVIELKKYGVTESHQSMAGLGYKETLQYLNGNITKDDLKCLIQQRTRVYAKKQLNWFKRFDYVKWLTIN